MTDQPVVGAVVIGRNEGERLKRCLGSIQEQHSAPVVYVDSGSTDGSAVYARSLGVDVVDLDISIPFTMARGRNAGLKQLVKKYPQCHFVQFIDGDCEMADDWLQQGVQFLDENQHYGGVSGNRRERFPEISIYNQLINMEWQGNKGEVNACGGDAIYRIDAIRAAGSFNESMIAGEEADLCLRIREQGFRLMRLDLPMTIHDADMHHFSQWWKRSVRCGHAYAHSYDLHRNCHGKGRAGYSGKSLVSSLFYGLVLPVLIFSLLIAGQLLVGLLILLPYGRIVVKAARSKPDPGNSYWQRLVYGCFIALGKLPESQGVIRYFANKALGKTSKIIEYKIDH